MSKLLVGCLAAAAISTACTDAASVAEPAVSYPEFVAEAAVTIAGYEGDAMEPFITRDGRHLFFNSLNDGTHTSLYYARRESDTLFTFQGEIAGANGTPPHLDAVASMDENGRFYFVSTRNYPAEMRNCLSGRWSEGTVSGVEPVEGDFYVRTAGWLVMDAEISPDGERLYFVNARFSGKALPDEARLGLARKRGGAFAKDPSSDELFGRVNDPDYLVYAPSVAASGGELYFTRLRKGSLTSELCVSSRSDAGAYGVPKRLAVDGDAVEAPSLTPDGARIYFHKKTPADGRYHVFTRTRR